MDMSPFAQAQIRDALRHVGTSLQRSDEAAPATRCVRAYVRWNGGVGTRGCAGGGGASVALALWRCWLVVLASDACSFL